MHTYWRGVIIALVSIIIGLTMVSVDSTLVDIALAIVLAAGILLTSEDRGGKKDV